MSCPMDNGQRTTSPGESAGPLWYNMFVARSFNWKLIQSILMRFVFGSNKIIAVLGLNKKMSWRFHDANCTNGGL